MRSKCRMFSVVLKNNKIFTSLFHKIHVNKNVCITSCVYNLGLKFPIV